MVFSSVSSGHQPDYKRFFDEQAYVEDIERRRQGTDLKHTQATRAGQ